MPPQRKIFISYRRADNPDFADRIRDWFIQRYGHANVFMDFDSIPPGVRFADHIRSSMKQSDAVIAVIGPRWVELLQERAKAFENDFVRIELSLALEMGKPITPICVNGASVPARTSLPADLRSLLDFNIAFLDRTNFYERIERIIAAVEATLDSAQTAPASEQAAPVPASDRSAVQQQPTQTAVPKAANNQPAVQHKTEQAAPVPASDQQAAQQQPTQTAVPKAANNQPAVQHKTKQAAIQPLPTETQLSAEEYFNRALQKQNSGNYEGAINDYTEAIRLNPQFADAYNNRGNASKVNGDLDGAIVDYNEAIRLNPQFADAYINRGNARQAKGRHDSAIADYTEAISLNSQFALAYKNRGIAFTSKRQWAKAIIDYQKYLDLGGGKQYGNQGQVERTIRKLQQQLNPKR